MPWYDFWCSCTSCNIPAVWWLQMKRSSGSPRVWIQSVAIAKHKGLLRKGFWKQAMYFKVLFRQLLQELLVFRKSTGQKIACGRHICRERLRRMQKAAVSNDLAGVLETKSIRGHQAGEIVVFNTGSISSSKGCFQHLSVNPHDTRVREGMSATAAEMKL